MCATVTFTCAESMYVPSYLCSASDVTNSVEKTLYTSFQMEQCALFGIPGYVGSCCASDDCNIANGFACYEGRLPGATAPDTPTEPVLTEGLSRDTCYKQTKVCIEGDSDLMCEEDDMGTTITIYGGGDDCPDNVVATEDTGASTYTCSTVEGGNRPTIIGAQSCYNGLNPQYSLGGYVILPYPPVKVPVSDADPTLASLEGGSSWLSTSKCATIMFTCAADLPVARLTQLCTPADVTAATKKILYTGLRNEQCAMASMPAFAGSSCCDGNDCNAVPGEPETKKAGASTLVATVGAVFAAVTGFLVL
jgi:hypothetical protein